MHFVKAEHLRDGIHLPFVPSSGDPIHTLLMCPSPVQPESVEAGEALQELEEEWVRREAEAAPGSALPESMKAEQTPIPQASQQEDAATQAGASLLAPQPQVGRPERKRRKQVTEGFN